MTEETPFHVECCTCKKKIERKFSETCGACYQLGVCKCETCPKHPSVDQSTVENCNGCGYAVCEKHSKELVYSDAAGKKNLARFCIFGDGHIHQCRDKFLTSPRIAKVSHRMGFSVAWFDLQTDEGVVREAQISKEVEARRVKLKKAEEDYAAAKAGLEIIDDDNREPYIRKKHKNTE